MMLKFIKKYQLKTGALLAAVLLNSLKSLVKQDQMQSLKFIDQLASIYRYMLVHNGRTEVTLDEEICFLKSYVNLLQIRYGEAFTVDIQIPASILAATLPPNTLQVLIENVVICVEKDENHFEVLLLAFEAIQRIEHYDDRKLIVKLDGVASEQIIVSIMHFHSFGKHDGIARPEIQAQVPAFN